MLGIAQRYRADFVIAHLFGGAPAVSMKEAKRIGYPLRKVLSFVWGGAEADVIAASGFGAADGHYTMQLAGVGSDYPVLKQIRELHEQQARRTRERWSRPSLRPRRPQPRSMVSDSPLLG